MTNPTEKTSSSGRRRTHRGDIMSTKTRSAVMSRIRGKGTKPELTMARIFAAENFTFESHARDLPGRPDFVFRKEKLVVFIDGDFWHGWQFPRWQHKLSLEWELKIAKTRRRDRRNFRKLRRLGWSVVRIWEHQVKADPQACLAKVVAALS